jgi:ubiquinone/menaquinone biosynthesis C-methylase UbiE
MKSLTSHGYACEGIETNYDYVSECLKNSLKVQQMNAEELRCGPNSFDTVLMIEVLEHLPEPIIALREAFRVAKKNVLISVPNTDVLPIMSKYQVVPWHLLEATHVDFFTPKILESVLNKFTPKIEVFTYANFASWVTKKPLHTHIFGIGWKDPSFQTLKD